MPKDRPNLTRERIVLTAVDFADAEGLKALTMRKLAARLGVEAMSLYNHIANKNDLLLGMIDEVIGRIERPSGTGDWKAAMRKRAMSMREEFLAHPWLPGIMVGNGDPGPNGLAFVEATVGCLRNAGFDFRLVDEVWHAIDSHVYGFTLQELNSPFDSDDHAEVAAKYLPMLSREDFPNLYAMAQLVAEGKHDGINEFTLGLDILLDGFERLRPDR